MKAKILLMIIIIPLIFYWFYNVSNFTMLLKDPYNAKTSNNFQELQANTMIIANSMRDMMFITIPLIIFGFSMYKVYLSRTKIFGVIPFDKINRHIIILGATGSGKTTMAKRIIKKIMKKKNAVIVFDWHGEYDLQNFEKIQFNEEVAFNIFDPWTINVKKYIVFLTNSLKNILELSEPQTYMLLRSLEEEYKERGYFERNSTTTIPIPPDINDILQRIQKMAPRSRFDYEVKVALEETPTFSSLLAFFLYRRGSWSFKIGGFYL